MSKNLSRDAAELLQVIERAPGHTRNELMKLAGISRRVWSNLSGELKAAKGNPYRVSKSKRKGSLPMV